jgi:diaminopimelate decarboxylase
MNKQKNAFAASENMAFAISRHISAEGPEWQPFYIYDSRAIRETCRAFKAIPYPHTHVHFATMANIHPEFLSLVESEGLGVFVNSTGHLEAVLKAGFSGDRIVYTASALDDSVMAAAAKAGALVNLDSQDQVLRWKKLHPGKPFGLRCNLGTMVRARKTRAGYFTGPESRLGLDPQELRAHRLDPDCAGLHLYVGTDIMDLDYFEECYRALFELARGFKAIRFLDLGGGFGIDDEDPSAVFDIEGFGKRISGLFAAFSLEMGRPIELILEPGRILGGASGLFVCRVTDVKRRETGRLVGVNASSAQFPRPLFYPDSAIHPVEALGARNENGMGKASVYGCSTYSRDYLARDIMLPELSPGSVLAFHNAGSYCASSYTQFLGFPKPKEIFA